MDTSSFDIPDWAKVDASASVFGEPRGIVETRRKCRESILKTHSSFFPAYPRNSFSHSRENSYAIPREVGSPSEIRCLSLKGELWKRSSALALLVAKRTIECVKKYFEQRRSTFSEISFFYLDKKRGMF